MSVNNEKEVEHPLKWLFDHQVCDLFESMPRQVISQIIKLTVSICNIPIEWPGATISLIIAANGLSFSKDMFPDDQLQCRNNLGMSL